MEGKLILRVFRMWIRSWLAAVRPLRVVALVWLLGTTAVSAWQQTASVAELLLSINYVDGPLSGFARVELVADGFGGETRMFRVPGAEAVRVNGLRPGAYQVRVRRSGFVQVSQGLELRAGQVAELRPLLAAAAIIDGSVSDRWGDPVPNIPVYARSVSGVPLQASATLPEWTDDQGRFHLHGIAAGQWRICAGTVAPVCYPQDSTSGAATPLGVEIQSHQELRGITLVLSGPEAESPQAPRVRPNPDIAGSVVDGTGSPVGDVPIYLTSERQRKKQVTNKEGFFKFPSPSPDVYSVSVGGPDFRAVTRIGATPPPISDPGAVVLHVERVGSVDGRLADEFGEPLEDVTVSSFEVQYVSGRRRLVKFDRTFASDRTDEAGNFRLHSLPLQPYYVGTVPTVFSGLGPEVGQTFYPGAARPSEATVVRLSADGSHVVAPFSILPSTNRSVVGQAIDSDGTKLSTGSAVLMPSPSEPIAAFSLRSVRILDGRFMFPGVPPGSYTIQALGPSGAPQADAMFGSVRTDLSTLNQGLTVRVARGHGIRGVVRFSDPRPPSGTEVKQLIIQAVEYDSWPAFDRATAKVNIDGSFEASGLHGRRFLRLPASSGYVITGLSVAGKAVADMALDLDSSDLEDVEVTLEPAATAEGRLIATSKVADVLVVAWSIQAGDLTYPTHRIQWARPATDGTYKIGNLPSGSYWIAAFTWPDSTIWQDPDFLRSLVPSAVRIDLVAGGTQRKDLPVILMHR